MLRLPPALSRAALDHIGRTISRRLPPGLDIGFAICLEDGTTVRIGQPRIDATITVNGRRGLAALASMDGTRMAEAYRNGHLDVEGSLASLLSLRALFADRHPITSLWRFLQPRLLGQVKSDERWIAEHYEYDPGFYLSFLDSRHRCYSQGIFAHDEEPLEDAIARKLDFAIASVGAQPGDRVLDIGGGWGAFLQYAGRRGIHVTSLTISSQSERFLQEMIGRENLPCRVLRQHLFQHTVEEPYDAIVNLGVTEHLPDYSRTLATYARLLKPGGRIYLDASASRDRYDLSAFLLRHIYPGNGSLLCLPDYLNSLGRTRFELLELHNDRWNYALTSRRWAENLDRAADVVTAQWGAALFRTFRLYLWGCVDGFSRDLLQAYRFVLQLPAAERVSAARQSAIDARRSGIVHTSPLPVGGGSSVRTQSIDSTDPAF